jgi:aryl-alcohol dehydrogenase-like predicted oxidoreductase
MKFRTLGKTGLQVSVIGLGTHQFSGEWNQEFSASEVAGLLNRARELGVNFIDTAECYGDHRVEQLIGDAIRGRRDEWIVATKFGHAYFGSPQKSDAWSVEQVGRQLDDSLRALQTDRIDLYQFHSGTNAEFDNAELWEMLNRQVHAGKIRFLGLSLSAEVTMKGDHYQLHHAGKVNVAAVQAVYNRLQQKVAEEILPFCEQKNLGVLARVPLAKGFLGGGYKPGTIFPQKDTRSTYSQKFNDEQLRLAEEIRYKEVPPGQNMAQWALAWCLKAKAVSSVIVGCKNLAQLASNAAAAELIS